MKVMKTDNISKASEKKMYLSPVIECIRLDSEISLILQTNSFNSLPGDPFREDCIQNTNQQFPESGIGWE
jgi:hypothetical protein